jgi:hypothetical protein
MLAYCCQASAFFVLVLTDSRRHLTSPCSKRSQSIIALVHLSRTCNYDVTEIVHG